jgi:hypothetical protein
MSSKNTCQVSPPSVERPRPPQRPAQTTLGFAGLRARFTPCRRSSSEENELAPVEGRRFTQVRPPSVERKIPLAVPRRTSSGLEGWTSRSYEYCEGTTSNQPPVTEEVLKLQVEPPSVDRRVPIPVTWEPLRGDCSPVAA